MALPDDVLADVLRRLAPRSLAASRCVCKAWRAIVDTRRLLLPDLLPHSVRGIFFMYHDLQYPVFLSRPSTGPEISGKLDFLPDPDPDWCSFADVLDHCNGLLLCQNPHGFHVANPATRRWARLPPLPLVGDLMSDVAHLVFDPTESPHYEVLLVPDNPGREKRRRSIERSMFFRSSAADDTKEEECEDDRLMEWPASTCVMCVFSSRTGRWEERAFAREGEAAGMVADIRWQDYSFFERGDSVYWRGVFYVQRIGGDFVMRISLSNDKYQVIKMPTDIEWKNNKPYLGRSEKGVCCALGHGAYNLQVWILDESCGQIKWVLMHQIDLEPTVLRVLNYGPQTEGPWILQDVNKALVDSDNDEDDNNKALVEEKFEWDSDNDNVLDTEYEVEGYRTGYITFLGFHPYKDVVFLNVSLERVLAYHLNSSMVQDLGISPKYYGGIARNTAHIVSSFPYTPCWMAEFPENNLEAHVED